MRSLAAAAVLAAVALIGGCVTYSPNQLASMSAADLCEVEYRQGQNLSPETRQAIQSELQRRNDNGRNHAAEVAQRFEQFMFVETYGRQLP